MEWHKKVLFALSIWWRDIKSFPGKIKRRVWNKRILLRWHRLWVRDDEFHQSLDINTAAMIEMNKKEGDSYLADLIKRRESAHQRDLAKR
ncbi:MAG TPA: hypothetical protein VMW82_01190 [Candidatus Paceibacterota bacterium]|nr:hypothetical protein [Candidatus Paceibacterota bacterium]